MMTAGAVIIRSKKPSVFPAVFLLKMLKWIIIKMCIRDRAKRVLDDLRIDISPDQIVGDLPVSKQQMVEIAKEMCIRDRSKRCPFLLRGWSSGF